MAVRLEMLCAIRLFANYAVIRQQAAWKLYILFANWTR